MHKKRDLNELREMFDKCCGAISMKNGKLCGNVLGRCVVHTDDERLTARDQILPPPYGSAIVDERDVGGAIIGKHRAFLLLY